MSKIKLSVVMATHDDFCGTFFTIQSIRMHHNLDDVEFIVLDNNPDSLYGIETRKFLEEVPNSKYVRVDHTYGTWVKYLWAEHATGDVILGLDCHVLLRNEFFPALFEYWNNNWGSRNMLTGPITFNRLDSISTRWNPIWRGHEFGVWGHEEDAEAFAAGRPFQIPMQGMGCYSVFRTAFTPFATGCKGFGAEEWFMAEHIRRNGGNVVCHPKMVWMHRFGRPVRNYPASLHDKIANYYRGWLDLYGSLKHPNIKAMTKWWCDTPINEEGNRDPNGSIIITPDELNAIVSTVTNREQLF